MSNEYMVLGINMAAGFRGDRPAFRGRRDDAGHGFEQLGFIGPLAGSAMVHDYALRGTFGLDYDLNPCNTVGLYYQSKTDFQFSNAVRFTNPITGTTPYQEFPSISLRPLGLALPIAA